MQVKGDRMLLPLLLLHSLGAPATPATARDVAPDPPVRVWFNSDGDYRFGDRAKVYAQATEDGNLVVLRADATGHVRVLYPWGGWWAPGYGAYWYGPRVGVGLRFGRPFFGPGRWHR